MAQVAAQQFRRGRFGSAFARQLTQLHGHLLCAGKQPRIPGDHRRTVITQGHCDGRQSGQHRAHQPLFGGVEGIELVDEHLPLPQKLRQLTPGKGSFQSGGRQFQTVGGVHAGAGQQGLVALKDQRQLGQFPAFRTAGRCQPGQLFARKARAFQLVDGLGGHLAEGRTAAVAVVVMHVVLQFFQRAAHQHGAARVRKSLHRRAALRRQDALGKAGKGKAFHHAGKRIPQFPVDAPLGAGGELFRHQQDAVLSRFGTRPDAGIEQGGLAAAGAAQNQFEHSVFPPEDTILFVLL